MRLILPLALSAILLGNHASAQPADPLSQALERGDFATVRALSGSGASNDRTRFALGAAQFLGAVEALGQGLHRHGLRTEYDTGLGILPFLRLPVPPNPDPEPVTYAGLRDLLTAFVAALTEAEATLAGVGDGPFDLTLDLSALRLDLDGDGIATEAERLMPIFLLVSGAADRVGGIPVDFDQSDAPWLQGYCHILMALAEFLLAHDWNVAFDQTFHTVFPEGDFPNAAMTEEAKAARAALAALAGPDGDPPSYQSAPEAAQTYYRIQSRRQWAGYADLLAFVHLFRWPVVEPERMESVRLHFVDMVRLSRENWRRIRQETDTGREWVPAPDRQESVFPRIRVTEQTVAGWELFLTEFEAVLEGRKLIPHWRFAEMGVDLRAMFEAPRTFDPVMIGTGPGVIPYLKQGELVSEGTVNEVLGLMGGGFFAYFPWFN